MIRAICLAFLCLATAARAEPPPMPMPWIEVATFYYTPLQVRQFTDNPMYFGANIAGGGWGPQLKRTWNAVDLRPYGVGTDPATGTWVGAKMAQLSCDLLITGYPIDADQIVRVAPHVADLTITVRAHSDPNAIVTKYLGQTIEAHRGGGQRSNFSTIVPLDANAMFDFSFDFPDGIPPWDGTSSGGAAFGANCSIQMWAR